MPKAYVVVTYRKCAEPERMQAYARLALPALMRFGAVFLARAAGDTVVTREAGLAERVVLIEFPSRAKALEGFDSEAYQAAYRLIAADVERDIRIIEGLDAQPGEPDAASGQGTCTSR